MRTIKTSKELETEVRKSRFICALARVTGEEEARAFLAERRRTHWNAAHNCTAYILGPDGQTQRSSDDGEPSGTAGAPMLDVLRHWGLTDTAAVVTRYFGGIKLGAGGLVRAYGDAVSRTVEAVGTLELRTLAVVRVTADYHHAGRVESELRRSEHPILEVDYTDSVHITVALPESDIAGLAGRLAELTAGDTVCERQGTTVVAVEP